MGEQTKIAWCDHTFNPWIGCTRVGPGCDHCYAEVQDSRMRWEGKKHWGAGVPRYRTSASNWALPLRWNRSAEKDGKPHRVFCASLGDVFDNEVPAIWRHDLWKLILATPHLSWLLVTKRIGNVEKMWPVMQDTAPPNVRLLITVCNQEEAERDIPKLLALNCKNGISYEPALGPVDWWKLKDRFDDSGFNKYALDLLDWIIVGGESGPRARPFDLVWARGTVQQCKDAGVPVFVKQLGRYPMPESDDLSGHRSKGHSFYRGWPLRYCDEDEHVAVDLKDRAGADMGEWPEDLRVRQFPT